MLEGEGKFFIRRSGGRRGGRIIASIHVSARLVRDSQFPFQTKDRLRIRIDPENRSLVIEKKGEV